MPLCFPRRCVAQQPSCSLRVFLPNCLSVGLSVPIVLYYVHRSQEDLVNFRSRVRSWFLYIRANGSVVSVHSGCLQWSVVRLRISSRESGLKGVEGWSGPVSGGQWDATPSWCPVPGGSGLILPAGAWLNSEVRSHQDQRQEAKVKSEGVW